MDINVCGNSTKLLPMLQTYTTKVLQPNICCKKNILTQKMVNCEGYKYVIRWDFDLNGKTILVPENCILEFDGGTLSNGTIIGQDTYINDVGGLGVETLFGEGITREGTWRMNEGGGSFEQVQSDWNQSDSTKPDYIKNKPTIPSGGGEEDKPYDPDAHSGLGRKTLKLGEDDSNILTQEDFDQENTIYVITYDFDLNGKTIEIPEGCALEFDGGSLSNGRLNGVVLNKDFHPEWFGAVGDGARDDTSAIQQCIDLSNKYGGSVLLSRAVYKVTHIDLKTKTHLKGVGIGASILKSEEAYEAGIVNVLENSVQCIISDLSIVGNKTQDGIYTQATNKDNPSYNMSYYLQENTGIENNKQTYRNLIIDNVYVGECRCGMNFNGYCYRVILTRSDIKRCVYGVNWPITDSSIHECYIEGCDKDGLILTGNNNNVTNIKSIWNGAGDVVNCYGINIRGSRNRVSNCEAQDNYCSGIRVTGQQHIISNVMANTDGYIKSTGEFTEEELAINTCEWYINTMTTVFSNCVATSYSDRNNHHFPKYPIRYGAAHEDFGSRVQVVGQTDTILAREPITPDIPIACTHNIPFDVDNIYKGVGYKIGDDKLDSEGGPDSFVANSINMAAIFEIVPTTIKSKQTLFRYANYGVVSFFRG